MPKRCSSASTLLSTSEPYRTGCLVSTKIFTGRFQSRTSETRASSVSRLVSPCVPSGRQLSCHAPYSSSRSWASVIVLTKPAPRRSPVQPAVVHANQMAVAGQPHIAFHAVGALFEREIVGGQGVFGPSGRGAAVGNDKRVPGEHLVGPRHDPYAAGSCPSNSTGAADAGRGWSIWADHDPAMGGPFDRFALEPFEDPGTAATAAAANRYAKTIMTVLLAMPWASVAQLVAMAKIETT